MNTPAWIGLGSNLGDRAAILDAALAALADAPGVAVEAVSSRHETSPVGGPPGQGPFLNAAARIRTGLAPRELLEVTRGIEDRLGRVRLVRWGERTIDIDLLIYGTLFLDDPVLKLPHPRLAFRRFVLAPLAEIAPSIVDTVSGRTIAALLANLDRKPRLLELEGPPGPTKAYLFRRLVEELPGSGVEAGDPGPTRPETYREQYARLVATSARLARRLDASLREEGRPRDRWLVADFYLPPGAALTGPDDPPDIAVDPPAEGPATTEASDELAARRASIDRLTPTLVVMLAPGESRRPGVRPVSTLWPESPEPDAILAEVLATCRGIEGS